VDPQAVDARFIRHPGAAALELLLLITLGPVRTWVLVGLGFYLLHAAVFVLGTPALANLLVLRREGSVAAKGFIVVPLCMIAAEALLFLDFWIFESLFGVNGDQAALRMM
jgi:hypothetical protein